MHALELRFSRLAFPNIYGGNHVIYQVSLWTMRILFFVPLIILLACTQLSASPTISQDEYLDAVTEILDRADEYNATSTSLTKAFVNTPAWRERSLANSKDIKSLHDDIQIIVPSSLFIEVHENLVLAFEHLAAAADLRIKSVASFETGDVQSATEYMLQSAAKEKEGYQQMIFATYLISELPRP